MKYLRQAAARERRFPIFWWLFLMVLTGGMLVVVLHDRAPQAAWLITVLLAAAWVAPILALQSMIPPRRARAPAPAPGTGSFLEWRAQARLLGKALIYYEENREIPGELRGILRQALRDLHDTLGAHPLRDDLERVCQRIRAGALAAMKDWLWSENRYRIHDRRHEFELSLAAAPDEDAWLVALQSAVEDAAAVMSRRCMPRMLERERLICARDCAWLAAQVVQVPARQLSPVELAAALVVEWSDFSEPWQPARVLHRAVERLRTTAPVPSASEMPAPAPAGGVIPHRHRVRVRVRKRRRHRYRGPSILDILRSFGQWLRYSIRSWMLYR